MNIPTTINAQLSQNTLSKVTRLFNASLSDILNELLQNARRAEATVIHLREIEEGFLSIEDDGIGIANPQTLLMLGESDWAAATQEREDAAGMGLFSLSSRGAKIASRGWQVVLTPEHFSGSIAATLEESEQQVGTLIVFKLTEAEQMALKRMVEQSTRFYPIAVWFNGEELPRQDFLESAVFIEEWSGLRIGVITRYSIDHRVGLNFYGLVVEKSWQTLPCNGDRMFVRVDVVDCSPLKLVLPARKELVQNEFLESLHLKIQQVLYRYVKTLPHHDLSYQQWQQAAKLGIELPEARARLNSYLPATANIADADYGPPQPISDRALILQLSEMDCRAEQVFWRAMQQANLGYETLAPKVGYVGYSWYDKLPCLSDLRFEIEDNGIVTELEQWRLQQYASGRCLRVNQMWAIACITNEEGHSEELRLACDLLLVDEPDCDGDNFEKMAIVLTESTSLEVGELARLLEESYFSPDEDGDSDSIYTQQEDFRETA